MSAVCVGEARSLADQVVPGVWWLHGTRGANVYLVEAGSRLVLVDTGFGSSTRGIVRELQAVAPGCTVSKILLTHAHSDHSGAARQLSEHFGAEIAAGQQDCVREGEDWRLASGVGHSHWLRRLPATLARVRELTTPVHQALDGEVEVAPGMVALPTPGHTPGSCCFVDTKRGVAFVGDMVISHPEGLARPLRMSNADDEQYLRSLAAFAESAPGVGCPGHGRPVVAGFGQQLRALSQFPRRQAGAFDTVRLRQLARFARGMVRGRAKSGRGG